MLGAFTTAEGKEPLMPNWEYCILTRLSAGLDSKWFVNRVFQHSETDLPVEVTADLFKAYNDQFEKLHASKVYPILPAVLNVLGAEGWELIDDMNMGTTGGEGLVLKRSAAARPSRAVAKKKPGRGR
jgi:hypothetical protein